ncbi:MAG: plasmid pRiA4b ORF-3 family protein [Endomicrobium sp.]|jgi:hypothetical protein|nr:plasmid pRiA4b ORF-3 family protein [Endomicrobium sp.]
METAIVKVELTGAPYKIMRTIQVPLYLTLHQFHEILQIIFDWENAHLYAFFIKEQHYESLDNTEEEIQEQYATQKVMLKEVFSQTKQFIYEYDFGDSWLHEILLQKLIQEPQDDFMPRCLEAQGESAFEDIGGIGGYADLLKTARKKKRNKEEQELIDWTGLSAKDIRKIPYYAPRIDDINQNIDDFWEDIKEGRGLDSDEGWEIVT